MKKIIYNLIYKIIYFFVCKNYGHEIKRIHPKYPATRCYRCGKTVSK